MFSSVPAAVRRLFGLKELHQTVFGLSTPSGVTQYLNWGRMQKSPLAAGY
jgi:hypothetical protein